MGNQNLGIDSLTIGVSHEGMNNYREQLKIAVIHEGKEPRYTNDYKLKNKIIL